MELEQDRRRRRQQTSRNAPEFDVFQYLRMKEQQFSDVIAHLLRPDETHQQGDRFLREFFRVVETALHSRKLHLDDRDVKVRREELTSFAARCVRRMDITIHLREWSHIRSRTTPTEDVKVVMIENKPFGGEPEAQMEDYCIHLTRAHRGQFLMIYLTKDGSPPTTFQRETKKRLEREDRLLFLSYEKHIADWISACRECCEADNVDTFLKDFQRKISSSVLGSVRVDAMTSDEKAVVKYALQSAGNLEFVASLEGAALQVRKELAKQLCQDLACRLGSTLGSGWSDPKIEGFLSSDWGQISIAKMDWPKHCTLCVSNGSNPKLRGLRYGVTGKKAAAAVVNLDDLRTKLNEKFRGDKASSDDKWLWRQDLEGDLGTTTAAGVLALYRDGAKNAALEVVEDIFRKLIKNAGPIISAGGKRQPGRVGKN